MLFCAVSTAWAVVAKTIASTPIDAFYDPREPGIQHRVVMIVAIAEAAIQRVSEIQPRVCRRVRWHILAVLPGPSP